MGSADLNLDDPLPPIAEQIAQEATPETKARLRNLVEKHVGFIWRSLRRLGVPESDIGDASQQVFLIASGKLALIRSNAERAFLFQTAMRVAANARRTQRRRREVGEQLLPTLPETGPDPEDAADQLRRRRLLDQVLDTMSLETRAVFVLSEIEELTMAEIAAMTRTPAGTVASRLRRAREQFREGVRLLREEGSI
jgi:RNA polymerase sigma-70 factor (ECF subfamily)